jgi:seryl-tRNA synthetase
MTAEREASAVFDIKWIRDNPDAFDAGLDKRGIKPGEVIFAKELIALDDGRRATITRLQELQARRNAASKEIGRAKASGDKARAAALMAEVTALKDELASGEKEQRRRETDLQLLLQVIPNLPAIDVPLGKDEYGNKEVRKEVPERPGDDEYNRKIDKTKTAPKLVGINKPLQHFEIGERLGLMDFETAAKLSGARFVVLKGMVARLERAIAALMLDIHTAPEKDGIGGYTEIAPPLIVLDSVMYGTAQLPKFRADQFTANREIGEVSYERCVLTADGFEVIGTPTPEEMSVLDEAKQLGALPRPVQTRGAGGWSPVKWRFETRQWLVPTAEVPLTNLVREKITDEAELPIRLTAFTPCFRAEAGAAGKDTRGMIRQHQFSKVELVSITTPEQSSAEHERMTACAEEVLKRLGLAYRTMLLCTGDMGFASQKTYDIEVWLPGQDTYREISSCSVCGDFQARRMNARYRPKGGKGTEFVHTLNGSGLAVGRTLIAILENYQQADGSVAIPDALQPYMGGLKKIEAA